MEIPGDILYVLIQLFVLLIIRDITPDGTFKTPRELQNYMDKLKHPCPQDMSPVTIIYATNLVVPQLTVPGNSVCFNQRCVNW